MKAAYYAGGGLPDAEVRWSVTSTPASFTPPNRGDFQLRAVRAVVGAARARRRARRRRVHGEPHRQDRRLRHPPAADRPGPGRAPARHQRGGGGHGDRREPAGVERANPAPRPPGGGLRRLEERSRLRAAGRAAAGGDAGGGPRRRGGGRAQADRANRAAGVDAEAGEVGRGGGGPEGVCAHLGEGGGALRARHQRGRHLPRARHGHRRRRAEERERAEPLGRRREAAAAAGGWSRSRSR